LILTQPNFKKIS